MRVIHLDAPIGQEPGELSARWFRSQLPTDGSPIEVRFHSEGGSLFESFAIYDAIEAYRGPKRAVVASMAFSAASLLLCAFDDVAASQNSYVMVHSPTMETDEQLDQSQKRLLAQLREKMIGLYVKKTGQSVSTISRLIDQETFFDSEASVSLGIVNRVLPASSAVMAKLPARVLAKLVASKVTGTTVAARWRAAIDSHVARGVRRDRAILAVDQSHPGLRHRMIAEANKR